MQSPRAKSKPNEVFLTVIVVSSRTDFLVHAKAWLESRTVAPYHSLPPGPKAGISVGNNVGSGVTEGTGVGSAVGDG